MKGYLFIFVSAISLGVTPILYKKCSSSIGPINTTFFYYLFGTLIAFTAWILTKDKPGVSVSGLFPAILLSIFMFISILSFTIGVVYTKVSIAATIRAFSFLFSVIIAVVFFKDSLSIKQLIGIICAGISVFLITS